MWSRRQNLFFKNVDVNKIMNSKGWFTFNQFKRSLIDFWTWACTGDRSKIFDQSKIWKRFQFFDWLPVFKSIAFLQLSNSQSFYAVKWYRSGGNCDRFQVWACPNWKIDRKNQIYHWNYLNGNQSLRPLSFLFLISKINYLSNKWPTVSTVHVMQNLWTFLFLSNSIEIIMSFQKKCWCHYENDLTEKNLAWYWVLRVSWHWKIFNLLPTSLRIQKQLSHSCPDVFCKKRVLWNFAKLTGKYLCQSLFFNKVAGLRQIIRVINSWLERQGSASAIFELKEIDSGNGSKRD